MPLGTALALLGGPFVIPLGGWPLWWDLFSVLSLVMAIWLSVIAMLMISNMATLSWASLRPRKAIRLWVLAFAALAFAALMLEPWWMLSAISVSYLALMPYGLVKYGRIKRRRAQEQAAAAASASGAAG
jgi:CDP-diacylglycerol--serine O-phosphatidyltransferase